MGAKGLKAIVVDQRGISPDAITDPEAFKEAARAYAKAVKDHPFSSQMMPALGTAGLVAPINSMGASPATMLPRVCWKAGRRSAATASGLV